MKKRLHSTVAAVLLSATFVASVAAQDKTPLFNQKIPAQIMTPNKVETHFGTLNFVDGVPTTETTQKLYDNLDYLRGVEVFLNFIPASFHGRTASGRHRKRREQEQPGSPLRPA